MNEQLTTLRREVRAELVENILPFWMNRMADRRRGGFFGRMTGEGVLCPDAPKGAILNARILWTFAAAYRLLGREEYRDTAQRAKQYLLSHFYDPQYGGVYWKLDADGRPLNTKKQIYALGFAIYGLSEYARATGDQEALDYAIRLFCDIERHSLDPVHGGYVEALDRQWRPMPDVRLSDKDENERKTMNTHLHILEPYANLYRIWPDGRLERSLKSLVRIFLDKIVDKASGHLNLFFEEDWSNKYHIVSYGHDIEASWLLHEAALVLGDAALLQEVKPAVVRIARAADEGLAPDGSLLYESFPQERRTDAERHWWVQAESVVGHLNLYQYLGMDDALVQALDAGQFIKQRLIDHGRGEWFWSILPDGIPNRRDDKAGFWKCPYHNGRMCMEVMERFP